MANPWFRLYSEFAADPKVQSMSEAMQRRLIMVFCMRCSNGHETLHDEEIAFHWRISIEELAETKALFMRKKFIDEQWKPLKWNTRQFESDSSTERVRRHREEKKRSCNVSVTPPDTDTDTECTQTNVCDGTSTEKQSKCPPCPIQEVIDLYHQTLPECPKFMVRNQTRDSYVRARWRQFFSEGDFKDQAGGIEVFRWFFAEKVKPSKFLTGRSEARNGRDPFVADLEWLMRPTNFAKVIEGKYS